VKDCSFEELEELVLGELDPKRQNEIMAHASTCSQCREELAWLRAEAQLFDACAKDERPPPPPFAEVLARARKPTVRARLPLVAFMGVAQAAAAVAALWFALPARTPMNTTPPPIAPEELMSHDERALFSPIDTDTVSPPSERTSTDEVPDTCSMDSLRCEETDVDACVEIEPTPQPEPICEVTTCSMP